MSCLAFDRRQIPRALKWAAEKRTTKNTFFRVASTHSAVHTPYPPRYSSCDWVLDSVPVDGVLQYSSLADTLLSTVYYYMWTGSQMCTSIKCTYDTQLYYCHLRPSTFSAVPALSSRSSCHRPDRFTIDFFDNVNQCARYGIRYHQIASRPS